MSNDPRSAWAALAGVCLFVAGATITKADAPPGRYVVEGGTVFDTKTQLTWQQEEAPGLYSFTDALLYCDGLNLGGASWRLPTMKELQTLVDESQNAPAIDGASLPNTSPANFWTYTQYAQGGNFVWSVSFLHGYSEPLTGAVPFHVRCVH